MAFLQRIMKNISQVVLLDNWISGLLILIALFVADYKVGIVALISSVLATLLGRYMGHSKDEVETGLVGFNAVLTGIALTVNLEPSIRTYLFILMAVLLTLPVGVAVRELLKPLQIPNLTMPYVFITWMFLFMSFQYQFVNADVSILPNKVSEIDFSQQPIDILMAFLNGFSEIFLVKNAIAGLLILIAIFAASRKASIFVIVGNLLGMMLVSLFGANHDQINTGLYSYNIVLVVIALGVTFKHHMNVYLSMVLGIFMTTALHAGFVTFLTPFGLPVLTFSFVIVTWIMLLAGKNKKDNITT